MSGNKGALLLAAALCLSACASYRPAVPREFARYGKSETGPLKAVSSDGVLFSVRSRKNEPEADLAFWREAMKTHMSQSGYRIVEDTSCVMGKAPAGLIKLAAPVGERDYLYWIAFSLSPDGKDVLVAEATGEAKAFRARADDIAVAIAATAW
jgi:hypothetical protein